MNKKESALILGIIKTAYPNFNNNGVEEERIVDIWQTMFSDESAELVAAAVKTFIASDEKGFPPHIGAIKSEIVKLTTPNALTEVEAWNLVRRKMRWHATHADFLELPPVIQRAVGSASQLCQWAMADIESLSVTQSNFMRSYRAALNQETERKKIPKDVLQLIETRKIEMIGDGNNE